MHHHRSCRQLPAWQHIDASGQTPCHHTDKTLCNVAVYKPASVVLCRKRRPLNASNAILRSTVAQSASGSMRSRTKAPASVPSSKPSLQPSPMLAESVTCCHRHGPRCCGCCYCGFCACRLCVRGAGFTCMQYMLRSCSGFWMFNRDSMVTIDDIIRHSSNSMQTFTFSQSHNVFPIIRPETYGNLTVKICLHVKHFTALTGRSLAL